MGKDWIQHLSVMESYKLYDHLPRVSFQVSILYKFTQHLWIFIHCNDKWQVYMKQVYMYMCESTGMCVLR